MMVGTIFRDKVGSNGEKKTLDTKQQNDMIQPEENEVKKKKNR